MLTVSNRVPSLAREIIRLEPAFATQIRSLETYLAACSGSPQSLPSDLAVARRVGTVAAWAAGVEDWNARTADRLALLRRVQPQPAVWSGLLELFAADFRGSTQAGLDASGAIFPGHVLLEGATFEGPCRLDGAQVMGSLIASQARFEHEFTAEQARFLGPVRLDRAVVTRAVRFSQADFAGDVTFDGSTFGCELWLKGARFGGALQMLGAALRRDGSFGCAYAGPAWFDGTRFASTVSFEGAVFESPLSLDGCVFDGRVFLDGIKTLDAVSFVDTRFNGGVRPSVDVLRKGLTVGDLIARVRAAMVQ